MSNFLPHRIRIGNALILGITLVLGVYASSAQEAMKPLSTEQSGFDVIGIETRTNNAQEATASGAIPKMWQRLFTENVLGQIPGRLDESIVALYTNYASDFNGDYSYILGTKVKTGTKPPEGMVSRSVPAGKYLEFVSKQGPGQQVVPEMWKGVWEYLRSPGSPARAYVSDYEIYGEKMDPNNVQAKLFLGVKP